MSMMRARSILAALLLLGIVYPASAGEPFHYPEAKYGKGELKYLHNLPVAFVQGTPTELGEQMARLVAQPARRLLDYPRDYLKRQKREGTWPFLVLTARSMLPQFPADYRTELETAVKAAGLDRDAVIVGNTMFDIKKIASCSTLLVDASRSATGGPLFGRNLDFPTLGYLQEYSLVIVARPKGKHAFVSVGFPGLLGVLSGMNDAGLTLAVLEVMQAHDGAPLFDGKGVPYAMTFRRILEECSTVAEAEQLLRSLRRTTMNNLAIADRHQVAVFEITPRSLVVRRSVDGLCLCTNHFRTQELATSLVCKRYAALEQCSGLEHVGLGDIAQRLHAANQGPMTLQTMIFEPATLRLHLAIGTCPSSALPLHVLELAAYLTKETAATKQNP
jgi:hypothetical protein